MYIYIYISIRYTKEEKKKFDVTSSTLDTCVVFYLKVSVVK